MMKPMSDFYFKATNNGLDGAKYKLCTKSSHGPKPAIRMWFDICPTPSAKNWNPLYACGKYSKIAWGRNWEDRQDFFLPWILPGLAFCCLNSLCNNTIVRAMHPESSSTGLLTLLKDYRYTGWWIKFLFLMDLIHHRPDQEFGMKEISKTASNVEEGRSINVWHRQLINQTHPTGRRSKI